jgi:predicted RNA methylase
MKTVVLCFLETSRERLVLDAGVGAGRFAKVASAMGAEVVDIDLTISVDYPSRVRGAKAG